MKSCKLVVAGRNSGKSTYLENLIAKEENPLGFLSLKQDTGYSLLNLQTGEERLYLSLSPCFESRFNRWYINEEVFSWAFDYISTKTSGALFLDEVGALELKGRGFAKVLEFAREKDFDLTLAVRDSYLDDVINRFQLIPNEVVLVPFLDLR